MQVNQLVVGPSLTIPHMLFLRQASLGAKVGQVGSTAISSQLGLCRLHQNTPYCIP